MKRIITKSRKILFSVSNLEKRHKVITYSSLIILTVIGYFLRTENKIVNIESAILTEKNFHLRGDMVVFNRSYENLPIPVWQKVKRGNRFVLQYVNPNYVNNFGHLINNNQFEVIGKSNFEAFTGNIAQSYYESDVAVAITGKTLESFHASVDKDGKLIKIKVLKWREIRDNKDTLVFGIIKEILSH
ncbi:hypothetical protein [Polaribacter ponticola]|uniref:MacB-like periplasmic core domain-containing protein n=1 Tax=Polaribacter ponticola TaxID=2978475 RepID=A0ABT5S5T5_9FLAO|nr:hypothetical protein [Polaribacter sp. MSW5]MDD7913461.1 hypothetical protein [Polaribacter sp. MSW5]